MGACADGLRGLKDSPHCGTTADGLRLLHQSPSGALPHRIGRGAGHATDFGQRATFNRQAQRRTPLHDVPSREFSRRP